VRAAYEIYTSYEHCHKCGLLTDCVIRWNNIRPESPKKTALCPNCAAKEQEE